MRVFVVTDNELLPKFVANPGKTTVIGLGLATVAISAAEMVKDADKVLPSDTVTEDGLKAMLSADGVSKISPSNAAISRVNVTALEEAAPVEIVMVSTRETVATFAITVTTTSEIETTPSYVTSPLEDVEKLTVLVPGDTGVIATKLE